MTLMSDIDNIIELGLTQDVDVFDDYYIDDKDVSDDDFVGGTDVNVNRE